MYARLKRRVALLGIIGAFFGVEPTRAQQWPAQADNLVLDAPIHRWDEAIPLGNGLVGCLFWGGGREIRLSLDRGDLWDERTNGPKEWWKTETYKKGGPMWEKAYHGATPTKLPAGAVFITLAGNDSIVKFELDKYTATGIGTLRSGKQIRVFVSAAEQLIMLQTDDTLQRVEVLDPVAVSARMRGGSAGPDSHSVNALGYPAAENGREQAGGAECLWYRQPAAAGLSYAAVCAQKRSGHGTLMAITVGASNDGARWLEDAQGRCRQALKQGYALKAKAHAAWWSKFWAQSRLDIPDDAARRYYSFARYLYGAGSRPDAPPMPLQGVWTAATGSLPPWKGDYHSDLNTQMTYMAYQVAGHFEEGSSYLNYLWNKRLQWRQFAKDFYETDGLSVPGVMSLGGQPLGGWAAYSLSSVMTSWNAHLFYLHWLYTADDKFLRERAYPWCREAALCLEGLLKPDSTGVLKLPRSSSPEMFGNQYWEPNTNYDIMSVRMHFLAVAEMALAQGLNEEADKWKKLSGQLGDYHTDSTGELLIARNKPLRESHRHLSTVMAVYPFNLVTMDGSEEDRRRISVSLNRPEYNNSRHNEWCGYSWGWMAAMRARVADGEQAYRHLHAFLDGYISRNGFHLNQDQTPDQRYGWGGGRPFTLEGNFIAMQAIQEMLLQSWSASPGIPHTGVLRIFPAVPAAWQDASFQDLRAEGGWKVSARRKGGKTVWFKVVAANSGGLLRIKQNVGEAAPHWGNKKVTLNGDVYEVWLKKGEVLEVFLQ